MSRPEACMTDITAYFGLFRDNSRLFTQRSVCNSDKKDSHQSVAEANLQRLQSWSKQLHKSPTNQRRTNSIKVFEEYERGKCEQKRREQTKNAHRVKEKIKSLIVFDIDELC